MAEKSYYLAPKVEAQLVKGETIKHEADQDRIYIITGAEGSGKSLLARQFACRLDPHFSLKDICFTSDEFAERIRHKERYGTVIFDEANNGLSSRAAISKENKKLIKLLQECRQRNLTIFIVLPSVFLLEKYVVLFRTHALFHTSIYKKDYKKRYYKIYNKANKKLLYILGHKYMSYSQPRLYKMYRFYGEQPHQIDDDEYREKKLNAFRENEKKEDINDVSMEQRNVLVYMAHKKYKIKFTEMSEWLGRFNCPINSKSMGRLVPKKLIKEMEGSNKDPSSE